MDLTPALTHLRNGDARAAHALLSALLAAGSDSAPLRGLLARACIALGDLGGARAALEAGLQLDRAFPPLWLERAMLARVEGRAEDAIAALGEAVRLMPQQPAIALDLASLLIQTLRIEEADAVLMQATARHASFAPAWIARGRLALQLGNAQVAEMCFASAQRLLPNDLDALRGLADAAELAGRADAERWARERVAALAPQSPAAHAELADALRRAEQPEAAAQFDRALALAPDDWLLRWMRLNTLPSVLPDQATREAARLAWDAGIAEFEQRLSERDIDRDAALAVASSATNFYRHYLGEPLLEAQGCYGRVLGTLAARAFPDLTPARARARGGRIRVGFVSAHLHTHTVLKLYACWLSAFERTRFETFAFHLDTRDDEGTAWVRRTVEHFVPARPLREMVETIRAAELDALIHLDVAMHPHHQLVAALRLAPLQCATWGHPITTGLDAVDVFLSSEAMEPADGQRHYSERLLRLPGLSLAYAPAVQPAAANVPLPSGVTRYVFCAQSAQKLHPGHDELFADVLAACPEHALVLVPHENPAVRERLAARMRQTLQARGVDPKRLVLLPGLPFLRFLGVAREADVVLDSLDWSGCTTTLESLAQGTPVVTWPGDTMRARHSAAMVRMVGAPDLVVGDRENLVALTAAIARDREQRHALRARIEGRREVFAADPAALAALVELVEREAREARAR